MKTKQVAAVVVLAVLATSIQGFYFASELTPPTKAEEWVPGNHMVAGLEQWMTSNFFSADFDRYSTLYFTWGIEGLDRSRFDQYNPDFKGDVVYDSGLDLTTREAQNALLDFCAAMQTYQCNLEGCRNAGFGTLMLQSEKQGYTCWLQELKQWLKDERGINDIPTGPDFLTELKKFRDNPPAFVNYDRLVPVNLREDIGIIGDELKYFMVRMRSTLPRREPQSTGLPVRDHVKQFVAYWKAASPASLQSLKFTTRGVFASYDLGQELIDGLFAGCRMAGPMILLVMLFSTQNWVISVLATFSVGSILMCVLGFCKSAKGWDLGVGEAIAGAIVIGYSVDYVIHLAHMYCEAREHGLRTREERAEFAIKNMGSTVFAGAITTAGSGAVMFICFSTFFNKMALLICITIFFSFLFSLGFFMGVMFLAGPQNDFGMLPSLKSMHQDGRKADDDEDMTTRLSKVVDEEKVVQYGRKADDDDDEDMTTRLTQVVDEKKMEVVQSRRRSGMGTGMFPGVKSMHQYSRKADDDDEDMTTRLTQVVDEKKMEAVQSRRRSGMGTGMFPGVKSMHQYGRKADDDDDTTPRTMKTAWHARWRGFSSRGCSRKGEGTHEGHDAALPHRDWERDQAGAHDAVHEVEDGPVEAEVDDEAKMRYVQSRHRWGRSTE